MNTAASAPSGGGDGVLGPLQWDLLPNRPWAALTAETRTLRLVRGEHCRTVPTLLTEWARSLAFPDYFGHNWDAFEECLTDAVHPPGAAPAAGLLVVVTAAESLLADEPPARLALLLRILDAVATPAPGTNTLLRVLFTTSATTTADTRRRLRAADHES
ncbi:barstar family protein [Kitasatospora sp. NPDC057223]|uniref:barstar family protein n=1 Tax=Kitasatospora sp. NPDC057223 TaxID=3346055 RepID=UPI0036311C49